MDLFNRNLPAVPAALSGQSSDIPFNQLLSMRHQAGRSRQKKGHLNFPTHTDAKFLHKVDTMLFEEPLLQFNGNGAEFASVTFLNPAYLDILKKRDKAARAKIESLRRYKKRVAASEVENFPARGVLGNIGNNLADFEKSTREKRYKIQEAIQKNNLVPGKYKEVETLNEETGEIEQKEVYQRSAVCSCGTPIQDLVHLKKNPEFGNVSVGGVATCGSVWACPVCRAKIVNSRAKELEYIFQEGRKKGWEFHMITFTVPHSKTDNLAALYGSSNMKTGLSGAFTKLRQSALWSKHMKPAIAYKGDVRAVEITWGWGNGFHPHIHLILISERRFDIDKWQAKILKQWQKVCKNCGLGKPGLNGVRLDYVSTASQVSYLSKWSVGSELQSESAKEAKGTNFSIAELEFCLISEEYRKERKIRLNRAAGVLKAYYAAMYGQKQLVYGGLNTGWKKELELEEKTDEELLSGQELLERDILIMNKSLYLELKSKNLFTKLVERLEAIKESPGYKKDALKCTLAYLKQHGINLAERIHWDKNTL